MKKQIRLALHLARQIQQFRRTKYFLSSVIVTVTWPTQTLIQTGIKTPVLTSLMQMETQY